MSKLIFILCLFLCTALVGCGDDNDKRLTDADAACLKLLTAGASSCAGVNTTGTVSTATVTQTSTVTVTNTTVVQ